MTVGDKSDLRRRLAAARAIAHAATPLASLTLAARLPAARLAVGVVAAYMPLGDEMNPLPLARRAISLGARIALPRTARPLRSGPLSFHLWEDGDPLEAAALGVLEPLADAPSAVPDVVLVPLLGFDRQGGRIGYGAGCYDRTLAALRAKGSVYAIGLAFSAQEVDATPQDPHDQPLDAVLTEREWILPAPFAARRPSEAAL
jgi:5-formyltetrahydrofolate cyclo-ligase